MYQLQHAFFCYSMSFSEAQVYLCFRKRHAVTDTLVQIYSNVAYPMQTSTVYLKTQALVSSCRNFLMTRHSTQ